MLGVTVGSSRGAAVVSAQGGVTEGLDRRSSLADLAVLASRYVGSRIGPGRLRVIARLHRHVPGFRVRGFHGRHGGRSPRTGRNTAGLHDDGLAGSVGGSASGLGAIALTVAHGCTLCRSAGPVMPLLAARPLAAGDPGVRATRARGSVVPAEAGTRDPP